MTQIKPFLKWAGGKTQLLKEIRDKISFSNKQAFTYIEPFVGSGAVLFHILNNYPNLEKAIINDANDDLINCYRVIKNDVKELITLLRQLEEKYNQHLLEKTEERKAFYYDIRQKFNTRKHSNIEQSSFFIFLNRTCFNGLYRVNSKNLFNVPQGSYKKPQICNEENLLEVAKLLQKVEILNGDFEQTFKYANKKSFFYFDPPYRPISKTASFTSYTKNCFDDDEQKRLKKFCDRITDEGSSWVLSNSDSQGENQKSFFDSLFQKYVVSYVNVTRMINANAQKRGQVKEVLINC